MSEQPIFLAQDLVKIYPRSNGQVNAVAGVNLEIHAGERLGIVGESGSGKSTLVRMRCALSRPTSGQIWFAGQKITGLKEKQLGDLRSRVQIVFQDPLSSLDPRTRVGTIITEPLRSPWVRGREGVPTDTSARLEEVLTEVGLNSEDALKYPHQFSGGQRQRIALARALVARPEVLIADEAVSALDVSVRAQVLNLIMQIAQRDNLTLLFVSHDLAVVRHLCQRVVVMRAGKIVEAGSVERVFSDPQQDYTRELIAAAPCLPLKRPLGSAENL